MEQFFCQTKLISGSGAVAALTQWAPQRLLLVTSPYFLRSGTARHVTQISGAEHTELFDSGTGTPTMELAAAGVARLRAFSPDLVVALGGGGTIDLGKAVVYFSKTAAPLVAIPTLSGSGAEVTHQVTLSYRRECYRFADSGLCPAAAILDSDLLATLPKPLIADGGFQILTHALEVCAAKNTGVIPSLLAREAFQMAYAYLPASFNGRQDVRLHIHRASTLAALAYSQSGLGLCHAMSHALERHFPLPLGRLHAILLPAVITCNAQAAGHSYAQLARAAGIGGSTDALAVKNLCSGLIRLRRELALPSSLAEAGIPSREVWRHTGQIVVDTLTDPCCQTNPVAVEDFLIRRLLEEITGHS